MNQSQLRVLVVDDHELVRSGVKRLLEGVPSVGEVSEASSGEQAIELAATILFDLVLMDLNLPGISGLEASERLLSANSGLHILVITGNLDTRVTAQLIRAGVRGCITKGSTAEEMDRAIRRVMRGDQYLSPEVAQQVAMNLMTDSDDNPFDRLTAREREIVDLLLDGKRNRHIADSLFISEKTVSTHRTRALDKLEVNTTAELVRLAMRHGLWKDD